MYLEACTLRVKSRGDDWSAVVLQLVDEPYIKYVYATHSRDFVLRVNKPSERERERERKTKLRNVANFRVYSTV